MSAKDGNGSGAGFVCPFCSQQVSTHNRPQHLRSCRNAGRDVQIERTQRNTIDAEYDRAMGERQ
jgi:hypothetical protein